MRDQRGLHTSLAVTLAMLLIGWLVTAALGATAQAPSNPTTLERPQTPANTPRAIAGSQN